MLIVNSAFRDPGSNPQHNSFRPIYLNGRVNKLLCEVLVKYDGEFYPPQSHFKENSKVIIFYILDWLNKSKFLFNYFLFYLLLFILCNKNSL